MEMEKNKLPLSDLVIRLEAIIKSLKQYETIEIKLNDNKIGEISIIVKSNYKEVVALK